MENVGQYPVIVKIFIKELCKFFESTKINLLIFYKWFCHFSHVAYNISSSNHEQVWTLQYIFTSASYNILPNLKQK